ncbi:MAG: SseB family protein [Methanobrevibacter sp.]|uniref:SseB family protein n=1 Tax=Methanobrevibacter sp. TaxID=66852 RepID=UPI0025D9E45B|nr:SseB family protein [Methanobrevibacter sp.]MBE6509395.1 SseB family protein [Methanobrevibacter sp.]
MELLDNSELEELMKMDVNNADERNRFLEKFKESQLIMPVEYSLNMIEGAENAKVGDVFEPEGEAGFNIIYLTDDEGRNAVPLFTSNEMMEHAGVESSAYVLFMSDLADLMEQAGDKYSTIAINPFTDSNINMGMGTFLNLFSNTSDRLNQLNEMLTIIKENSIELKDNMAFMLRSDENFMKDGAVDGIYQSPIPMNLNSDPHYNENLKFTNILLFKKSHKLFYLGETVNDEFDTIVAPGTKFEFVRDLDEFTSVWECGEQPFYDEM